jgi:hypothetical protein
MKAVIMAARWALIAARPDEGVADEQGGGAEAVEQGVERGQKGVLRAGGRGGMNVDQPEEKEPWLRR